MGLSGLDIYKLLPKTNCKKCGSPTCLAFAMKLAMKKASIDECPEISEEAKIALAESSRPPILLLKLGTSPDEVEIGGETVLFRHEKTFYHQTAIAVSVEDVLEPQDLHARVIAVENLRFERVGQHFGIDMIALLNTSKNIEKYLSALTVILSNSKKPLILMSGDSRAIEEALKICNKRKVIIYPERFDNIKEMVLLAKSYNAILVVTGDSLEDVERASIEARREGLEELILDPSSKDIKGCINDYTQMRRLSIKRNYRPFGYPTIRYIKSKDKYSIVKEASTLIAKYASIIIIDLLEKDVLLPIITLRQNIYTDPQKPVTVEPKLYKFGQPDKNSPLMVTTNFSLTFYTVSPEIEASNIPSYLLVTDSEGMSVLTAWAAEKFTPESITESMKKANLDEVVDHKKIIIPGYVAVLSGRLEDISGWKVLVGPKEASGIPKYLKEIWR